MILGFPRPGQEANLAWQRRRDNPVFSMRGMIATAHPLATAAGLRVLQREAGLWPSRPGVPGWFA